MIRSPWWWPIVDSSLSPLIVSWARERGAGESQTAERVWAVVGLIINPTSSTRQLQLVFPEVTVNEGDARRVQSVFIEALGGMRETSLARLALQRLGSVDASTSLATLVTPTGGQQKRRRDWRNVFSRSRRGPEVYFLRNSHLTHRGSGYLSKASPDFDIITNICYRYGLVGDSFHTGMMLSASTSEEYYCFLDGGFESKAGDYFAGAHGAWVIGHRCLRFLCFELGLSTPPWNRMHGPAPNHDELKRELLLQFSRDLPSLHQRLKVYRGDRW